MATAGRGCTCRCRYAGRRDWDTRTPLRCHSHGPSSAQRYLARHLGRPPLRGLRFIPTTRPVLRWGSAHAVETSSIFLRRLPSELPRQRGRLRCRLRMRLPQLRLLWPQSSGQRRRVCRARSAARGQRCVPSRAAPSRSRSKVSGPKLPDSDHPALSDQVQSLKASAGAVLDLRRHAILSAQMSRSMAAHLPGEVGHPGPASIGFPYAQPRPRCMPWTVNRPSSGACATQRERIAQADSRRFGLDTPACRDQPR